MNKDIFLNCGAIKEGHFLLSSGLHSQYYFQAQSLLKYPPLASKAGKEMAGPWKKKNIDAVVSLAVGGIVIGQEVARYLKTRHVFLERKNKALTLERGFSLSSGERILMVEDVITTGGSLLEGIQIIKEFGIEIAGISALVIRGKPDLPYTINSTYQINWEAYSADNCPLCAEGIPMYIPGTKQSKNQ
ncbi:orotate phosphoribosyltransferase [Elusimicrobiota bacterium]